MKKLVLIAVVVALALPVAFAGGGGKTGGSFGNITTNGRPSDTGG